MIKTLLNIDLPIIPNQSLGGVLIGQKISELKDWIFFNFFFENKDDIKCEVFNGLYVNYSCLNNTLSFTIDIITGKVIFINAHLGYEGELFNGIKTGISFFDLKNICKNIYHQDGFILFDDIKGLRIDVPEEFELYDGIDYFPDFTIKTITVYKGNGTD